MRKLLIFVCLFLFLGQAFILVMLNFYENQFLNVGLSLGNYKIQAELDEKFNSIQEHKLYQKSRNILKNYIPKIDSQIESIKTIIKEEFYKAIQKHQNNEYSLSDYQKVDFEVVSLLTDMNYVRSYLESQIKKTLIALRRDLNIVFGSNILVLLLVFIFCISKQESKIGIKLSVTVLLTILASTFFYFYSQDWFYTILMNSYYGYTYTFVMLIHFLLMSDIIFNKGRIIMAFLENFNLI